MSDAINNLPPEMQARLAQIMAQANNQQAPAATPEPAPAPVQKPPSLMDHVIALRQEVAALRQELHASSQVTEAVGNAVGQLYAMFQQSPSSDASTPTYSQAFQQSVDDEF